MDCVYGKSQDFLYTTCFRWIWENTLKFYTWCNGQLLFQKQTNKTNLSELVACFYLCKHKSCLLQWLFLSTCCEQSLEPISLFPNEELYQQFFNSCYSSMFYRKWICNYAMQSGVVKIGETELRAPWIFSFVNLMCSANAYQTRPCHFPLKLIHLLNRLNIFGTSISVNLPTWFQDAAILLLAAARKTVKRQSIVNPNLSDLG